MSKINETNYPRRTQASYADTDMLVIQAAGGNTYTTRLEDMREDYKETLAPILSALQDDVNENLATIEGSTASKAYAKGDFLVFGGRLCKAKTSIASGATLVLDTNIELDSVGDELSSISSQLSNIGSRVDKSDSASCDAGVTTTVCTITLNKGLWLVMNYMDLASPLSNVYNNTLSGRIVRAYGTNGGGSTNWAIVNVTVDGSSVVTSCYVPSANTARCTMTAIRIK